MKHRSRSARPVFALLVGLACSLVLAGCRAPLYYYTQNQYGNRAVPPSGLQQRVLAAYTNTSQGAGTTGGGAEILDGLRDLRHNVQNTIPTYTIGGLSVGYPLQIINNPEQQTGYILDYNSGSLTGVNYATEKSTAAVATFGAQAPSAAASPDGARFLGAEAVASTAASANTAGQLVVTYNGTPISLALPNVDRVFINQGNTVLLAMTRNTNSLYRVVQLASSSNPVTPPGSIDCEPLLLPIYCVVPVAGTYDRPMNAYFSLDGTKVYILNSGPENGGQTASISVLNTSALSVNTLPTVDPASAGAPSPLATLPVANPVPIPGGVTAAVSDGTNLYVSGQSLFRQTASGALTTTPAADDLFTGFMTTVNETSYTVSNPVSVSDGTHTKMLLADNNTLWVGSQHCATGERAATGQNYNCLTMVQLGSGTPTATVVPAVTPGGTTTVPYPNTNGNLYYYGDLTGICWVQNFGKVYTAYGGQIHAFYTGAPLTNAYEPGNGTTPAPGTELDNTNVTVQGNVLDVAYMDALTNAAN